MTNFNLTFLAIFCSFLSLNNSFGQNNTQGDSTKIIVAPTPLTPPTSDEIFEVGIEEEPVFPGGEETMQKFIKDNLVYPAESTEKGEQGKVYVRFVVGVDGAISNISIPRGVSPSADAEAIRIVKMMPNWTPGKQGGTPVSTVVVLPIVFKR